MMAMACLTPLLFLLWVGVTVSTVMDLEKRIIGGSACGMNERHYHVRLRMVNAKGSAFCGGSLISDQWILTAAHCHIPQWTMFADLRVHPGPQRSVQITDPPVIFKDKRGREHDIMLVKLPSKTQTQTVGLPKCRNRPKLGASVQIAGHAASTSGPNNQRRPGSTASLQCADTTIVECQDIINHFKNLNIYNDFSHEHWICGKKPQVDVCKGDSGGGVVYQNRIYGVISKGDPSKVCINPAVFVDICHRPYISWIKKTIAKEKQWLKSCLNCG